MPDIEIRNNPDLKGFLRNITELGFTGIMWGIWIYLFLPLVNIVLWLVGVKYFHLSVIENVGYRELLDLLHRMGWTVLIIYLILRLWGYYNYLRFGRRDRRKKGHELIQARIADHFGLTVDELMLMQNKKEIFWPDPD